MDRRTWIIVGIILAVALGTGYLLKVKTDKENANAESNSQLPAESAQANYNVPPSIGVTQNSSALHIPDGSMFTMSEANSLPSSGTGE